MPDVQLDRAPSPLEQELDHQQVTLHLSLLLMEETWCDTHPVSMLNLDSLEPSPRADILLEAK